MNSNSIFQNNTNQTVNYSEPVVDSETIEKLISIIKKKRR